MPWRSRQMDFIFCPQNTFYIKKSLWNEVQDTYFEKKNMRDFIWILVLLKNIVLFNFLY